MIGTKLFGLSAEQSPIKHVSCEPTGLKYLKDMLLILELSINFSHNCFVSPYGDSAFLNGAD